MSEEDKIEWGMMKQSIESIKDNQMKMDHKLDSMINYIDERFREQEDKLNKNIRDSEARGKETYAGKYIERLLLILVPVFFSAILGLFGKVLGIL